MIAVADVAFDAQGVLAYLDEEADAARATIEAATVRLEQIEVARSAWLQLVEDAPAPAPTIAKESRRDLNERHHAAKHAPPPKPVMSKDGQRSAPKQSPKRDRAEVARIAREAHAAGRSMTGTVAEHFGISYSAAGKLLTSARQEGHDVPRQNGGRPSTKPPKEARPPVVKAGQTWSPSPGENVLRCQEPGCTHVEPISGATALNRHCMTEHGGRTATVDERMPERWTA